MVWRRRDVVDDGCAGHCPACRVGIGDVCLDEVDLAGQAPDGVTGDGSDRDPPTEKLVDHGPADRPETRHDVELRF
jgi:hypothetical protein